MNIPFLAQLLNSFSGGSKNCDIWSVQKKMKLIICLLLTVLNSKIEALQSDALIDENDFVINTIEENEAENDTLILDSAEIEGKSQQILEKDLK